VVNDFFYYEVVRLYVLRRRDDRLVELKTSVRTGRYRIIFDAKIITVLINTVFCRSIQIEDVAIVVGVAVVYKIRNVVGRLG
jgi:hypothetical protein